MNRYIAALIPLSLAGGSFLASSIEAGEPCRIDPALLERLVSPGGGGEEQIGIKVRLRAGASPEALRAVLDEAGATGTRTWPEIRRLNTALRIDRILDLARDEAIEWIEELPRQDLDRDENDGVRNAIGLTSLAPLYAILKGEGVKMGAWENGHPDVESLSGLFHGHDDIGSRVKVMEPSEPSQHATMVAGIVAGDGRACSASGGDPYQWRGIAPGVSLHSYSTADSDEEVVELLSAIGEERIQIAINSWGEAVSKERCWIFGDYNMRAAEFDQAIAGDDPEMAGEGRIPVVFSVGNYQDFLECLAARQGAVSIIPGFRTINPPHTAKNIIAVGAIRSDDLKITHFSSWGPTDDGRIKPDMVAPGSESGGDGGITTTSLLPPDGYRTDEGTSFSAAALAGALAILIGEREDRKAPPLPPAAWKAILLESALDLTDDPLAPATTDPAEAEANATRFRGPDFFHGFGMLWIPSAFALSMDPDGLIEGRVEKGEEVYFGLLRPSPTAHRITLVWDDPAGDPAAPRALVNDLDLRIEEALPEGGRRVHLPWVLNPLYPDLPATRGVDELNNVEQVEFVGPIGGALTVVVSGARAVRGPQRFWLAADEGIVAFPERDASFILGDGNSSGLVDISDAITIIGYLFLGVEISCMHAADPNLDGRMDISDPILLLRFLFLDASAGWLIGQCLSFTTTDLDACSGTPPCL